MADDIAEIWFSTEDEGIDYPHMARDLVYQQAMNLGVQDEFPEFSLNDVYLVWFAFTLGNFKALCSTSVTDGRYYEVTYSRDREEAFVDTYKKTHNVAIKIVKQGEING